MSNLQKQFLVGFYNPPSLRCRWGGGRRKGWFWVKGSPLQTDVDFNWLRFFIWLVPRSINCYWTVHSQQLSHANIRNIIREALWPNTDIHILRGLLSMLSTFRWFIWEETRAFDSYSPACRFYVGFIRGLASLNQGRNWGRIEVDFDGFRSKKHVSDWLTRLSWHQQPMVNQLVEPSVTKIRTKDSKWRNPWISFGIVPVGILLGCARDDCNFLHLGITLIFQLQD